MNNGAMRRAKGTLWTATTLTNTSTGLVLTGALVNFSLRQQQPAPRVALTFAAAACGALVGAVLGGWITDRSRSLRATILVADVATACVALSGALVAHRSIVAGAYLICPMFAANAVSANARQVLAADYFPGGMGTFSAWSSNLMSLGQVLGSTLAVALAVPVVSLAHAYGFASMFVAAAAALRATLPAPDLPSSPVTPEGHSVSAIGSPTTLVRGRGSDLGALVRLPLIRLLLFVVGLLQISEAVAAKLFVPFVVDTLAASTRVIPVLEVAAIAGGFAGAAIFPRLGRGADTRWSMCTALAVMAFALAAFGLSPSPWLLLPLELLISAAGTVVASMFIQLLVGSVGAGLRGRVFALLTVVTSGTQIISLIALAAVTAAVGLRTVFVLSSIPLVLAAWLIAGRAGNHISGSSGTAPTSVDSFR